MIKSIKFITDGNIGYINKKHYDRIPNPRYKEKSERRRYTRETKYIDKENGYENVMLRKCVINRTFEFVDDRVNILFGPNRCGKSTITNTLAHYTMCGDNRNPFGSSHKDKFEPMDMFDIVSALSLDRDEYDIDTIRDKCAKASGNKAVIEWDGSSVYCPYIDSNIGFGGELGSLQKQAGFEFGDEVCFRMERSNMSMGETTVFMLFKIAEICKKAKREIDLTPRENCNDTWRLIDDAQIAYIKSYITGELGRPTIILDELDKCLDVLNVISLYNNFLPGLCNKLGMQVIVVSHNPLVMSNLVYGNKEQYNFISMLPEYTEAVRENISSIKFDN